MQYLSEKDKFTLLAMLEAIDKIEIISAEIKSAEEFEKDFRFFDACMMNFIVLGEMTLRLSPAFLEKHSEVEWHKMRAFRNLVAHDYFGIDLAKVWDIIKLQLPPLKTKLKQITEN
ncbi:MAG: DUF86 domain-containing protein [Bacteroidetes bacterium CG_4_8_14_3_um_filter_31_14]|nr:MAG: DUF86 domain-containing protein [Bacteroidetes bacterium CG_4_8_14_3_um_filter_31_14]